MFKNYIVVAMRHFSRHKMFTALNMFCLAIGISFCILISRYIVHESSINSNLNDIDNQYFLNSDWKIKNTGPSITTVGPLAKALKENYPGLVKNYYRFNPVTNVVSAGDKHFKENIAIGDTTLISMYKFPLLYGNPSQAFTNNSSAVISEELAMKLFGETNVLGKTVTLTNLNGSLQDYKVSAVMKSISYNTINNYFDKNGYSLFIPFEGNHFYPNAGTGEDQWNGFYIVSYVELNAGITIKQAGDAVKRLLILNSNENISKNLTVQFKPLKTFYLDANNGSVSRTLSILGFVAIGILLLAVVNFINIMMGTSGYRIKEIGLRIVFGSRRKQLVLQYLIECIVLTLFAFVLSLLFYELLRPLFNEIWHTRLDSVTHFNLQQYIYLLLAAILVGILAGIYPALVLSRSNAVSSVKGKLSSVESSLLLRKSLLVIQFTVAIVVLIFSLTVNRQVNYFFHKDLGYDKEQLMVLMAFPKEWDSVGVSKMENIRNNLVGLSSVKDATLSFDIPERTPPSGLSLTPEGSKDDQQKNIESIVVDEHFASTFGLHLIDGRFFRIKEGGFKSGEAVINESAMKDFGWTSAVGKKLRLTTGGQFEVVGVVKDFNVSSLHESIGPLIFIHMKDAFNYRYLTVKLAPGDLSSHIEQIREKWKQSSPNSPFEYFFMDEKLQSIYQSELQLKKASTVAISLMLVIVMLGIFGVLTLTLTKRTKEIAVRKVLGADISNIVSLFITQYAGLLLIANLIAWPLTFYLSKRWLDQYVYRIDQNPGIYIFAAAFVTAISFTLIYVQCFKAAIVNPVKSLKTE